MSAWPKYHLRTLLILPVLVALFFATIFLPAARLSSAVKVLAEDDLLLVRLDQSLIATVIVGMRRYHLKTGEIDSDAFTRLESNLPKIPGIESASISAPDKQFDSIIGLLPRLSSIEIAKANDSALHSLIHLNQLSYVKISGESFTGSGLAYLARLRSLEVLDLSHTSVNDNTLAELASYASLKYLVLSDTKITNEGLSKLQHLGLRSLELDRTTVTEKGIRKLANFTKLEKLSICSAMLQEESFIFFGESPISESLELLRVNVLHVDSLGVSDLQRALPRCNVYSEFTVSDPTFEENFDLSALELVGNDQTGQAQ